MFEKYTEEDYYVKGVDETLLNQTFGYLKIIEPFKYRLKCRKNNWDTFVKCGCSCGRTVITSYCRLKAGQTTTCNHCGDNEYVKINDIISFIKIYNYRNCIWEYVLVNTECVDYLKTFGRWNIWHKPCGHIYITVNDKIGYLSRAVVSFINSKYNLPKLLDNQEIDHIDGNTFNNLYYPYDDYYNNLRVCNRQQNVLNEKAQGYTFRKEYGTYQARIVLNGSIHSKSFSTPQECIDHNNELLSKSFPELAKYYYHHPNNPRNWPWTFGNSVLGPIGFNDGNNINDEDFNENMEE